MIALAKFGTNLEAVYGYNGIYANKTHNARKMFEYFRKSLYAMTAHVCLWRDLPCKQVSPCGFCSYANSVCPSRNGLYEMQFQPEDLENPPDETNQSFSQWVMLSSRLARLLHFATCHIHVKHLCIVMTNLTTILVYENYCIVR